MNASAIPFYREGGDMWVRARTNAMAHRLAAEKLETFNVALSLLISFLIVVPIVTVAVSFQYVSAPSSGPLPFAWTYAGLALAAIICNGAALFLGMAAKDFKYAERAAQHRTLSASYAMIAQKVRRLESAELGQEEARYLYRHLQETFEIYKANSVEPDDKTFSQAQALVSKLKPHPFGITA